MVYKAGHSDGLEEPRAKQGPSDQSSASPALWQLPRAMQASSLSSEWVKQFASCRHLLRIKWQKTWHAKGFSQGSLPPGALLTLT